MVIRMLTQEFNWTKELEKTVITSLTTSFGLDFLLFKDKEGGDVDTIHNVRNGIYATDLEKERFNNQEAYNSHDYHTHKNYIAHGRSDKALHREGNLKDNYRNQMMAKNEDRQLDHTISANEIHNDRGRVLAGLNGAELANRDTNLNSTHWYVNNLKRDHSVEKFVNEVAPKKLETLNSQLKKDKDMLKNMPQGTAKERHLYRQKEAKIKESQEKIGALETVIENKESMLKADEKARSAYNKEINQYYLSSKFLKNAATQATLSGLKMGARQAIGLILAEVWFELRENLSKLLKKHRFDFNEYILNIKEIIPNIFKRVQERFKDILKTFKDASLSGILSSISTTLLNTIFTTSKILIKIIRELWSSLIQVAKIIFFNPDNLSLGQLTKSVFIILSGAIATTIGSMVNNQLNTLLKIPFGLEISAFLSALLTGILTLGATYFLQYSEIMQKVWNALDTFFVNKYNLLLEEFQAANKELNLYLEKLCQIEFNLNIDEIQAFNDSLTISTNELEKTRIIKAELEKRDINMSFEFGNPDSVKSWLIGLRK